LASIKHRGLLVALAAVYVSVSLMFSLRPSRATTEQEPATAGSHRDLRMIPHWRRADAGRELQMTAVLALRNRVELKKLQVQLQQPGSPNYHKWLSTEEFMRRFGPTRSQMNKVANWLAANHFRIGKASLGTRTIRFSGSVAEAERAFSTEIVSRSSAHANVSDLQVPASLDGSIVAILGLNRRTESAQQASRIVQGASVSSPAAKIGGMQHFAPQDLWTFYDEKPPTDPLNFGGTGPGDCIGLLESQTVDPKAIKKFTKRFHLPRVNLTVVPTNPGNPVPPANASEPYLDVEWAHAVAPNTPIALYVANDAGSGQSQLDALSLAVFQNACGVISSSIHDDNQFCPDLSEIMAYADVYSEATTKGMTIFHASGDFGSFFDCGQPGVVNGASGIQPSIDESAASADVTVVGGTQFKPVYGHKGANTSVIGPGVEHVWNKWDPASPAPSPTPVPEEKGASTGGLSVVFDKPVWPEGLVPHGLQADQFTMRGVPDVSAAANSDIPGLWIATTKVAESSCGKRKYCFVSDGGTSVASPIWAGISRLIAQNMKTTRLGNINPRLYALAASGSPALVDVSNEGQNCPFSDCTKFPGYKVGPGYDLGTGLGSPDINLLISDF
jgi:subtilase family serine protease